MADDDVTITLPRREAVALVVIAEHGLRAVEAFNLIKNTSAAERALNEMRKQIG